MKQYNIESCTFTFLLTALTTQSNELIDELSRMVLWTLYMLAFQLNFSIVYTCLLLANDTTITIIESCMLEMSNHGSNFAQVWGTIHATVKKW